MQLDDVAERICEKRRHSSPWLFNRMLETLESLKVVAITRGFVCVVSIILDIRELREAHYEDIKLPHPRSDPPNDSGKWVQID